MLKTQKFNVRGISFFLSLLFCFELIPNSANASSYLYQVNEPDKLWYLERITCMMAVEPENYNSRRTKLDWRKSESHSFWVQKATTQKLNCGVGNTPFKLSKKGNRIAGSNSNIGMCNSGDLVNCYGYKLEKNKSLSLGAFNINSGLVGYFWNKTGHSFFGYFSNQGQTRPYFNYNESFIGFPSGHLFAQGFGNDHGGTLFHPDGKQEVITFDDKKSCSARRGNDCLWTHFDVKTGFAVGIITLNIEGGKSKRMLNGIGLFSSNNKNLQYGVFKNNHLVLDRFANPSDPSIFNIEKVLNQNFQSREKIIQRSKADTLFPEDTNLSKTAVQSLKQSQKKPELEAKPSIIYSNEITDLCVTVKKQIEKHIKEQAYIKAQEATSLFRTMNCIETSVQTSKSKTIESSINTIKKAASCIASLQNSRGRLIKNFNAKSFDDNPASDCSIAAKKCNKIASVELKRNGVPKKSRSYKSKCDIFGQCKITETNSSSGGGFATGFFEGLAAVEKEKSALAQFFELCMVEEGYDIF